MLGTMKTLHLLYMDFLRKTLTDFEFCLQKINHKKLIIEVLLKT
jgi:hypothetical protein